MQVSTCEHKENPGMLLNKSVAGMQKRGKNSNFPGNFVKHEIQFGKKKV